MGDIVGVADVKSGRTRGGSVRPRVALLCTLLAGLVSACAPAMAPPPNVAPRFPDLMFPGVPADLPGVDGRTVERHERSWQFLQAGDLPTARRGFQEVLQASPGFFPAEAGLAYVEYVERRYDMAVDRFTRVLEARPTYVPALIGRGESLLLDDRTEEALASFEAAVAADPSLKAIERRVEVLRFRSVQERITNAERAKQEGRFDEARSAYLRALESSPESAFLHRELGEVELGRGDHEAALDHLGQALALDPGDARALVLTADAYEALDRLQDAVEALTAAARLDDGLEVTARVEALRERLAYARLPAEYRELETAPEITRAGLAALIGVRLASFLETVPPEAGALITDARDSWALTWIMTVVQKGVMPVYPNHTFQPAAPVRRGEMAEIVSRVLRLVARTNPSAAALWSGFSPAFTDVSPSHLQYEAASMAVAARILATLDGGRFGLAEILSGAEAAAAVDRLAALAVRPGAQ